jgi:nitrogen fixation protein FixH
MIIVLSGHLGVRPAHKRKEDFERANGVHVFAVAVLYFALVIAGLIILVNVVAG